MRLLPESSGVYSEGLASFILKVVQEALNTLKMEAANSFETLVPININKQGTIFHKTIKCVKLRLAEQNTGSVAPIKSHVYHFLTPLAQNAVVPGFLLLTSEYLILLPLCSKPVAANIPKDKCAISYCNVGATVSVSAPSAVTPPCASLVLSVSAELVHSVLPTGSSAQRISQLCFCVCYQGVSKWRQLTMPAFSRGSLGTERVWWGEGGVITIWKQLFPK